MAGFGIVKAMIFAVLLLTLTHFSVAEDEKEGCGEGSEEKDGKCVCKEEGEQMDDEGDCCIGNMLDMEEGKIVCQEEPETGSVAVAQTLILSFTFLISLQYWTNSEDVDMKRYGYKVISSTVSIFCAVLMFQCIDGLVDRFIGIYVTGEPYLLFAVDFCHFLIWYLTTQMVIALASGATGPEEERNRITEKKRSPLANEVREYARMKETLEASCSSYGVVCAHLTGFAAINAWTGLQQCDPFNSNPIMVLLPIIICVIVQLILQRVANMLRERYIAGDGSRDMFEAKWDEECEEAENDVLGLTLSVMMVNSVRMAINGMDPEGKKCLPNQEQMEESEYCEFIEEEGRAWSQIVWLCGAGFLFVLCLFFVKLIEMKITGSKEGEKEGEGEEGKEEESSSDEEEQKTESEEIIERISDVFLVSLAMCFSWCTFHFNKQLLIKMNPFDLGEPKHATTLAFYLALEVTLLGFIATRILDMISDLPDEYTPPAVDESLAAVIDAIAIFIGFAWEQTFDASVDSLAEKFRKDFGPSAPSIAKFIIGSLISSFIFHAWKKFTVPFVVKQGWDFNYVFSALDIPKTLDELEKKKGGFVGKKFIGQYSMFQSKKDLTAPTTQGAYRALPGEETDSLKAKNAELLMKLKQAEEEKLKAQESLDQFMDSMFASLKGMNETVSRIEAQ